MVIIVVCVFGFLVKLLKIYYYIHIKIIHFYYNIKFFTATYTLSILNIIKYVGIF